nr:hypothetical protein [uncultured Rhodopila sp.]
MRLSSVLIAMAALGVVDCGAPRVVRIDDGGFPDETHLRHLDQVLREAREKRERKAAARDGRRE